MLRRRRCGISVKPDVTRSPLGTALSVRASVLGRVAQCQHGSDQVQQRPGKVMLSDHGDMVIHADVVDGDAGDRPVRYREGQGAGGEFLPFPAVALPGGVHHAALHGAVALDSGHHDSYSAHSVPVRCGPGLLSIDV